MILRNDYLEDMKSFRDKRLIKALTGIRHCGKTTLFELYQDYLQNNGVAPEQILSFDFENEDYAGVEDSKTLYDLVKARLLPDRMNYIFLDEVQHVRNFQKAVDALFIKKNCDLYIAGSNTCLLSGELATLLSGRYVEIKVVPLSFKEYVSASLENSNIGKLYQAYIHNKQYTSGSIEFIVKDIAAYKSFLDISILQNIACFLFYNIGNVCSAKEIADFIAATGHKISIHTAESYRNVLTDSFIFYPVEQYNIAETQYLKTGDKYYTADIGLYHSAVGSEKADEGRILKNIVYLELLRRGYKVYTGKAGTTEIDFIAIGDEGQEYYQTAYAAVNTDRKALERELTALNTIKCHGPKYLLTMGVEPIAPHKGIKQINALDWLLK